MKRHVKRNPKRIGKLLAARVAKATVIVEIVPLEVLPEPVVKNAVLNKPRRAKGVLRSPKLVAGRPIRVD
jgi:hypothetical protein